MNSLKERLTSRKLWVTITAAGAFIAAGQFPEAVAVVVAYLGVEGAADVVAARADKSTRAVKESLEKFRDALDKSE